MACLMVVDDDGSERTVPLSATDPVYVGRGAECAIRTATSTVSRRHSAIRMEGDGFVIEDLGSTSGVYVNNTRVQKQTLVHGDVVQCGSLTIRFMEDMPAEEATLLANIQHGDHASRFVYADWLEQHADSGRAEYLRLQDVLAHELDGKADWTRVAPRVPWEDARIARLRELAHAIPIAWRKQVVDARAGEPCDACGNLRLAQLGSCMRCHPPPPTRNPPPPGKQCSCGTRNAWSATSCEHCHAAL